MQAVTADFQLPLEQIQLRAFSGTVRAFYDDQRARIRAARNRPAWLRKCGLRRLGSRRFLNYILSFHEPLKASDSNCNTNGLLLLPHYSTLRLTQQSASTASEQGDLDVQEFLRVLPEISHQQAHVSGKARQIIVELRITEQLTGGCSVVVQFRSG